MSMQYFDSNKVKIFPCTYRGTDADAAVYDPEARLLSEYNLTHLPARLPGRTSYVIQYTNGKLLCNMAGYLVEIELQATAFPNLSLCLFYLVDNTQTPKQILCPADGQGGITDGARIAVDLNGKCMCLAYTTDNSGFSTENSKISMATLSVWKNGQPTVDWLNPLIESVKGDDNLIRAELSSDKRSVTISTTATKNPQVYTAVQVQHNGETQGTVAAQSQRSTLTLNTSGELIKGGVVNGAAVIQSVELGDNLKVRDNKLHAANSIYGLALNTSKDQISLVEDGKDKSIKLPSYSLTKDEETLSIQLRKDGEIIASVQDAAGISEDGANAFSTATVNTVRVANASANKNLDLKYKLTQAANGALQLRWDTNNPVSSIDPIKGKLSLRQNPNTGVLELCWPNSSTSISPVTLQPFKISGTTCNGIHPWAANLSSSISIPNNVTTIAANAFKDCTWITSVTIPQSVTSIGNGAFQGCTALTDLTLPFVGGDEDNDFLGYIFGASSAGLNASYVPSALTSVKILNTKQEDVYIATKAFYGCSIQSIILGEGIVGIGESAFEACSKLSKVTLPDSLSEILNYAFKDCVRLSSINLPGGITSIGKFAFENCKALTTIQLPDGGDQGYCGLQSGAFCGSGLVHITLPALEYSTSVKLSAADLPIKILMPEPRTEFTSIFKNCSSLTSVTWDFSTTLTEGNSYLSDCFRYLRDLFFYPVETRYTTQADGTKHLREVSSAAIHWYNPSSPTRSYALSVNTYDSIAASSSSYRNKYPTSNLLLYPKRYPNSAENNY